MLRLITSQVLSWYGSSCLYQCYSLYFIFITFTLHSIYIHSSCMHWTQSSIIHHILHTSWIMYLMHIVTFYCILLFIFIYSICITRAIYFNDYGMFRFCIKIHSLQLHGNGTLQTATAIYSQCNGHCHTIIQLTFIILPLF